MFTGIGYYWIIVIIVCSSQASQRRSSNSNALFGKILTFRKYLLCGVVGYIIILFKPNASCVLFQLDFLMLFIYFYNSINLRGQL